jgi:hypothetical protein
MKKIVIMMGAIIIAYLYCNVIQIGYKNKIRRGLDAEKIINIVIVACAITAGCYIGSAIYTIITR